MDGRSLKAIEKHREVRMGERSTEQRGQTDESTGERRRERARSRQIERERKRFETIPSGKISAPRIQVFLEVREMDG